MIRLIVSYMAKDKREAGFLYILFCISQVDIIYRLPIFKNLTPLIDLAMSKKSQRQNLVAVVCRCYCYQQALCIPHFP